MRLIVYPLRSFLLLFVFLFSSSVFATDYVWITGNQSFSDAVSACLAAPNAGYSFTGTQVLSSIHIQCIGDRDPIYEVGRSYAIVVRSGTSCPVGTELNAEQTECGAPPCAPGSLAPDCSVSCPAIHYSYTENGIAKEGSIGGGNVGHGQSCPQPAYPSGVDNGSACESSVAADCANPDAVHESENVDTTSTDSQVVTNPDGSTTETTSTTSSSSGGSDSGGGANSGSSDGAVIDSNGLDITGDPRIDDTVNIGDSTLGLCDHGGIIDGDIGCDYVPSACAANEIATSYGCEPIPQSDPPPDAEPTDTTQTTTNPDGSSTSTTTSTSGSGDSANPGNGTSQNPAEDDPVPTGSLSGGGTCASPPVCEGDPILCHIDLLAWERNCSLDSAAADMESEFQAQGMTDLNTMEPGSLQSALIDGDPTDLAGQAASVFAATSSSNTTCPVDPTIDVGLGTVTVPIHILCTYAAIVRSIIMLIASVFASMTLFRYVGAI
ncbi:MAG: hypothetical protein QNK32_01940 [Porticoccus sp.]|nr:hypothetical protein [Porticoccus sp.]